MKKFIFMECRKNVSRCRANAPCTQHILTCTQHNFKNSKNTLYSGNKNSELKIIYSGKIYPEVVIEFQK